MRPRAQALAAPSSVNSVRARLRLPARSRARHSRPQSSPGWQGIVCQANSRCGRWNRFREVVAPAFGGPLFLFDDGFENSARPVDDRMVCQTLPDHDDPRPIGEDIGPFLREQGPFGRIEGRLVHQRPVSSMHPSKSKRRRSTSRFPECRPQ